MADLKTYIVSIPYAYMRKMAVKAPNELVALGLGLKRSPEKLSLVGYGVEPVELMPEEWPTPEAQVHEGEIPDDVLDYTSIQSGETGKKAN